MLNKILVFTLLMINIGSAFAQEDLNKSVYDDVNWQVIIDRCDSKSDKLIDVHDTVCGGNTIWQVISKCDDQFQSECNDAIKRFKSSITKKSLVSWYNGRFQVHLDGCGGARAYSRKMSPLELAVLSGSIKATKALLKNGANSNERRTLDSRYCDNGHEFPLLHSLIDTAILCPRDMSSSVPGNPQADYKKIAELLVKYGLNLESTSIIYEPGDKPMIIRETAVEYCYGHHKNNQPSKLCDFLRKCEFKKRKL